MSKAPPRIKGFDRQGEPELRLGDSGALELIFNFMPPMTAAGEERYPEIFETFEAELTKVLGVPVARDDREHFIIAAPKADTADTLAAYLSNFWKEHAKALSSRPAGPDAPFRSAKEFLAAAHQCLKAPFASLGFKKRAGQQLDFARKAPFGEHFVNIYADNFGLPYRHIVTLSVVDDRVERPYVQLAGIEDKYARNLRTASHLLTVTESEPTKYGLNERPDIRRPSDLAAWAPKLITELKRTGFPWFDASGDLGNLAAPFNDLSSPLPEFGDDRTACLGVILARLTGAGNIADIAAYHRKCLAKLEIPMSFPKIEAFVIKASQAELFAMSKPP